MELKPGYKQTEVGVIPEDWDAVPLKSLSRSILRGASPRPIQNPKWFDQQSHIGWVRISDVTKAGRYLSETMQKLSTAGIRNSRFVPSGGLIMSICATVGRPIETKIDICIHDGFVVFEHPLVSQSYLYHILKDLEPHWSSMGQTGSQMNLNTGIIGNALVPVPQTINEQEDIATALSDVDALLDGLDRLIAKKRDLKQATMQQLLTGETRLPGFEGEWEVKRLGDIGQFKGGSGFPTKFQGKISGTYPFFKVSDMNNDGNDTFMISANNYIDESVKNQIGSNVFPAQTIVFAKVGAAVFLERKKILIEPSCIDNNMSGYIIDTTRSDVRFMHYSLLHKKLGNLVSTTALPSLSGSVLAAIKLFLPPFEEQTAIATVLSDMDAEIAALEQRRDKTKDIKQAMMQELLTGKTRLVTPGESNA